MRNFASPISGAGDYSAWDNGDRLYDTPLARPARNAWLCMMRLLAGCSIIYSILSIPALVMMSRYFATSSVRNVFALSRSSPIGTAPISSNLTRTVESCNASFSAAFKRFRKCPSERRRAHPSRTNRQTCIAASPLAPLSPYSAAQAAGYRPRRRAR